MAFITRFRFFATVFTALVLCGFLAGCGGGAAGAARSPSDGPAPLRVGVAANSPPMVYKDSNGKLLGLEIDFANRIGKELGRPVEFVEMNFGSLVGAVQWGRIDIAMSGITITPDREQKVLFTTSYLKTGQCVMVRTADRFNYYTANSILQYKGWIGSERNTTGDAFAKRYMPNAKVWGYGSIQAAAEALLTNGVGMVIGDMPTVAWLANRSGGECYAIPTMLTIEFLAWPVSKDNEKLKTDIDRLVFNWQSDGSIYRMINSWVPSGSQ